MLPISSASTWNRGLLPSSIPVYALEYQPSLPRSEFGSQFTLHDHQTPIPESVISARTELEQSEETYFHLILTLSSSSGCCRFTRPPNVMPLLRAGTLGERMNDLSAPRLILAITRLLRLSECFLSSVPLTAPAHEPRGNSPNIDTPIIIPIQHDMIKLHP